MVNIAVIGGAGFIGSHLVDRLIELGHEVVVIDNFSTGKIKNINKRATIVKISIIDNLDSIFEACNFDYVFHLAAQIDLRDSIRNPINDANINIIGSLNIIQNCIKHNVKKLIFTSTGGAIYSENAKMPWTEKSAANPVSPYGLAKLTVEKYIKMLIPDSVIFRLSNVYGPRQSNSECGVISIFLNNIRSKNKITVLGSGEQSRDFIFVSDVIDSFILALEGKLESGIFNVSTGVATSLNDIIKIMRNEFETDFEIEHEEFVPGEMLHSRLSSEKLIKTGWKPSMDLKDGLQYLIKNNIFN